MNTLDELIKDRSEKVRLMEKDGDNSHKLLAELYGSPTHFITELLQNAEDEGAVNVEFNLSKTGLEFSHDSKKLFDFNDIRAISNFGDNIEKKEKPNAIGRFGIGFKSVYAITERPRIISADFDITIESYNIPRRTKNADNNFYQGTKIILPFKKGNQEGIYKLLERELEDLNIHYLLFLSNISSIKWKTEGNSGVYKRTRQRNDKRIAALTSEGKEHRFVLLEKKVKVEKKELSIKIAFQLAGKDRKYVVPCEQSPLFVFFPTKIETNLKFLIHAPFYTTPARENIQEDDNLVNFEADSRNKVLKVALGKFLAESLVTFKAMNLLSVEFLEVLPIDDSNCHRSPIYEELYNAVKAEFLSNKELIPNSNGEYSAAKDTMLLGSSDLAELLTTKQTTQIFRRKFWVTKKITNDKTKQLRDYLYHDLDLPEYDLTEFAKKIDADFMSRQTDNWIIQFYKTVHKANALWRLSANLSNNGVLRTKPIIRIDGSKAKHIAPFQRNGKPNVFLPAANHSKYATVKRNIFKDKDVRKFLEDLGLTYPDLFAEINEFIIPRLRNREMYEGYFDDFNKILEAYKSSSQEKRSQMIEDLKGCSPVLGFNLETGETKLLPTESVYLLNENLKTYFAGNSSVYFVAEEQYSLGQNGKTIFNALLKELGVKSCPRRISFPANLTWEEKKVLRGYSELTYEYYCIDYYLEGLDVFLKNNSLKENTKALWELLIGCLLEYSGYAEDFFNGEYKYKYYSDYYKNFESKLLKQLKSTQWIILDSGNFRPSEISYINLPDDFKKNELHSKKLCDILGFKADEIKEIEERTGGKFIPADEYEKYKQWKRERENENQDSKVEETEEEEFNPTTAANEVQINARDIEEGDINTEFEDYYDPFPLEEGQNENNEFGNNRSNGNNANSDSKVEVSAKRLKEIGDWGEEYVFRSLQDEFDDSFKIIRLNDNGRIGVGADFKVTKDGKFVRLVEVKSTTSPFGIPLIVSGTQWEIARNFFKQSNGDVYWIYCVFNVGNASAEIIKVSNPIKKWQDGKLLAHPVNFIIK